jgi:hypothetical protein
MSTTARRSIIRPHRSRAVMWTLNLLVIAGGMMLVR